MKILLIYPQYTHSSEFDSRTPSMSLVYLSAALERGGHEVVIYDASLGPVSRKRGIPQKAGKKSGAVFRYGVSDEDMRRFLLSGSFDMAGITCAFTSRWRFVSRIAELVKKICGDIPVATGGLFPTSSWEYCLTRSDAIDFIILGEGELSFTKIADSIASGKDIGGACRETEGAAWRDNGRIYCNPKLSYNDSLDELPFPAWHLMDLKKYFSMHKSLFELPAPNLPLLSSRSCPNRCRFCNMYITHGSKWRKRSAESVLDEIGYLMERFRVKNFYFIDDNFSLDLERAKRILNGILERGYRIRYNFYSGLSIKTIDFELVRLMKRSGCTSVCLAVESGSERIRNEVYGKKLTTEKIFEVFEWCRSVGIPTIGYFMVGAPGETREDFEESKKIMARLPMSLATVGIYTPYPGTELYDECKQKGWLIEKNPEDEERVEMFSSMLRTPDFEPEDVAGWQKELYLCFIRCHWPTLIKEAVRPGGLVNLDTVGKFLGMLRFRVRQRRTRS